MGTRLFITKGEAEASIPEEDWPSWRYDGYAVVGWEDEHGARHDSAETLDSDSPGAAINEEKS